LLALPMSVAGAQTNGSSGSNGVPPDPPGACSFSVTPTGAVAPGTVLTISGVAPTTDNTTVFLFINGVQVASQVPAANGSYSFQHTVVEADFVNGVMQISVNFTFGNQNAYTAVCTQVGGEATANIPILVAANEVVRPAAALAFTGSDDTPSFVLIGVAALVVGGVLVVAARRRKQVS
jgi:LPXTG-motif cell wall-anchored protein